MTDESYKPMGGYVYIMSNKPQGTLYIGVTSDLSRRVFEHREKLVKGFTSQYDLNLLVYYEIYDDIRIAIQREKNLKHWLREWKLALIHEHNPEWKDLYLRLNE
jgi:putative endonuclease